MFTPDRKCSKDDLPRQQGSQLRASSPSYLFICPKPIRSPARSGPLPSEDFSLPSEVTAKNTSERTGKQTNKQTDMKNSSWDWTLNSQRQLNAGNLSEISLIHANTEMNKCSPAIHIRAARKTELSRTKRVDGTRLSPRSYLQRPKHTLHWVSLPGNIKFNINLLRTTSVRCDDVCFCCKWGVVLCKEVITSWGNRRLWPWPKAPQRQNKNRHLSRLAWTSECQ